jgi:hypothetical protein
MKLRVALTIALSASVFLGVWLLIVSLDSHPIRHALSGAVLAGIAAGLISWRWVKRQT